VQKVGTDDFTYTTNNLVFDSPKNIQEKKLLELNILMWRRGTLIDYWWESQRERDY
jgi:hypothetical protein